MLKSNLGMLGMSDIAYPHFVVMVSKFNCIESLNAIEMS